MMKISFLLALVIVCLTLNFAEAKSGWSAPWSAPKTGETNQQSTTSKTPAPAPKDTDQDVTPSSTSAPNMTSVTPSPSMNLTLVEGYEVLEAICVFTDGNISGFIRFEQDGSSISAMYDLSGLEDDANDIDLAGPGGETLSSFSVANEEDESLDISGYDIDSLNEIVGHTMKIGSQYCTVGIARETPGLVPSPQPRISTAKCDLRQIDSSDVGPRGAVSFIEINDDNLEVRYLVTGADSNTDLKLVVKTYGDLLRNANNNTMFQGSQSGNIAGSLSGLEDVFTDGVGRSVSSGNAAGVSLSAPGTSIIGRLMHLVDIASSQPIAECVIYKDEDADGAPDSKYKSQETSPAPSSESSNAIMVSSFGSASFPFILLALLF